MKKPNLSFVFFLFLVLNCGQTDPQFESLLSSPENFDGKQVEVTGYFHDRFEDVAIYFKNDDNKDAAIWVDFGIFGLLNTIEGELDGKRITLVGTFERNSKGHLTQYAGTIHVVTIQATVD